MSLALEAHTQPEPEGVVTTALVRAAEALALPARVLAEVIGLSEASVSRLKARALVLKPGSKPFELGLLFIRLFRALDAITGDSSVAAQWLRAPNAALGARPLDLIVTVPGLVAVLAYLDARRALV